MRGVSEQLAPAGSITIPELVGARFLLTPGRKYDQSVKSFEPYDRLQVPDDSAVKAGATLMGQRFEPRRKTYVYVNNRLEGNALETINRMIRALPELPGLNAPQST